MNMKWNLVDHCISASKLWVLENSHDYWKPLKDKDGENCGTALPSACGMPNI
jgi:hypothetical protein